MEVKAFTKSMKKTTWLILVAVVLVAFGVWYGYRGDPKPHPTEILNVNGTKIESELVSSPADVQQGLSDRSSMRRNQGMLFELGRRDFHTFWMNRMRFPLDIIWIDGNTVVDIAENLPAPKFGEIPYTYTPTAVADRVLEVTAGVVAETKLKVGDVVGELTLQ